MDSTTSGLSEFDGPATVSLLRDLESGKRRHVEQLRKQADVIQTDAESIRILASYLEQGWSLHVVEFLKQHAKTQLMQSELGKIIDVSKLEVVFKTDARHIMSHFPRYFEKAIQQDHLNVDPDSRHPVYTFDDHFFEVHIVESGKARISTREGLLKEIPADPDAILSALQSEHRRIFDRPFKGKEFLAKLRRHYLAVIERDRLADGASVPIRQITARMGKNIKGFHTDEFLHDLSRLVMEGPLSLDGKTLDLQHTKDTRQGMLLHGRASRGYIGFITFRKER